MEDDILNALWKLYGKKKHESSQSILCNVLFLYIVMLATVFEGEPKALFSVATTPRCKRC